MRESKSVLLTLYGLPGAGKTTLARALSARHAWPMANRDEIRLAMFPDCRWSDVEKQAATEALFLAVEARASMGKSCIVDGMSFSKSAERERVAEIAARYTCVHVPVWLDCPVELAARRVECQREHPAGDRSAQRVREVAARFAPVAPNVLQMPAELNINAQLESVAAYLRDLAGDSVSSG